MRSKFYSFFFCHNVQADSDQDFLRTFNLSRSEIDLIMLADVFKPGKNLASVILDHNDLGKFLLTFLADERFCVSKLLESALLDRGVERNVQPNLQPPPDECLPFDELYPDVVVDAKAGEESILLFTPPNGKRSDSVAWVASDADYASVTNWKYLGNFLSDDYQSSEFNARLEIESLISSPYASIKGSWSQVSGGDFVRKASEIYFPLFDGRYDLRLDFGRGAQSGLFGVPTEVSFGNTEAYRKGQMDSFYYSGFLGEVSYVSLIQDGRELYKSAFVSGEFTSHAVHNVDPSKDLTVLIEAFSGTRSEILLFPLEVQDLMITRNNSLVFSIYGDLNSGTYLGFNVSSPTRKLRGLSVNAELRKESLSSKFNYGFLLLGRRTALNSQLVFSPEGKSLKISLGQSLGGISNTDYNFSYGYSDGINSEANPATGNNVFSAGLYLSRAFKRTNFRAGGSIEFSGQHFKPSLQVGINKNLGPINGSCSLSYDSTFSTRAYCGVNISIGRKIQDYELKVRASRHTLSNSPTYGVEATRKIVESDNNKILISARTDHSRDLDVSFNGSHSNSAFRVEGSGTKRYRENSFTASSLVSGSFAVAPGFFGYSNSRTYGNTVLLRAEGDVGAANVSYNRRTQPLRSRLMLNNISSFNEALIALKSASGSPDIQFVPEFMDLNTAVDSVYVLDFKVKKVRNLLLSVTFDGVLAGKFSPGARVFKNNKEEAILLHGNKVLVQYADSSDRFKILNDNGVSCSLSVIDIERTEKALDKGFATCH